MKTTTLACFTSIGFALTSAFAVPAFAQDTKVHDHATHAAPTPQMDIDIDYVLTESPDDHVIGATNAPVTIIAYASVTCPHCAAWFTQDWPVFKAAHVDTGHVRFILRELPTPPQEIARAGFIIADCAPKDQYFDHIEHQMQNQKAIFEKLSAGQGAEVYQELGQLAGLETEADLIGCLYDDSHNEKINRAALRARAAGLSTVPGFYIDGELVKGETKADNLSAAVTKKMGEGQSPITLPVEQSVTPIFGK